MTGVTGKPLITKSWSRPSSVYLGRASTVRGLRKVKALAIARDVCATWIVPETKTRMRWWDHNRRNPRIV